MLYFIADNNGTIYGHDLTKAKAEDVLSATLENMTEEERKTLEPEIIEH